MRKALRGDRKFVLAFVLLSFAGLTFWILNVVQGTFSQMMDSLGVEILGAIVTALGVLGLERIYAKPDPQLRVLTEQVKQQTAKIDVLQKQLQVVVFQLSAARRSSDTTEEQS
jgi:hypothetical protein